MGGTHLIPLRITKIVLVLVLASKTFIRPYKGDAWKESKGNFEHGAAQQTYFSPDLNWLIDVISSPFLLYMHLNV